MSSTMRVLAVGDVVPWPSLDGYRLRFAHLLGGMARRAVVDLFVAAQPGEGGDDSVPEAFGRRCVVEVPPSRRSAALVLTTLGSSVPRRILWRDWGDARRRLADFAAPPYDVVWYSHADTYAALGEPEYGPAIVDLDNLEDRVLRRPPPLGRSVAAGSSRLQARALARWAADQREVRCWARLQRRIVDEAERVVVCSELDRSRLGPSASVVPNGYPDPGAPRPVPSSRTLVMVGHFTYQPNLDAAAWLVRHVVPRLRSMVPEVEVRLVGHHDRRLPAIGAVPGVTVVGRVPEVEPELRAARGAVVPVMSGSGTRIKVIEALAYGMPIVSTSLGCEGIGIEAGRHALVCDDPAEFAAACARVLTDDALCDSLGEEGRGLYLDRYSPRHIEARVDQLLSDVASAGRARAHDGDGRPEAASRGVPN